MDYQINVAVLPEDYGTMAEIHNALFPDDPVTAAAVQRNHENPPAKCRRGIFMARANGHAVGYGTFGQEIWAYAPNKFRIQISVPASHQRRGIGSALYLRLLANLDPYKPRQLVSYVREDMDASVRFVEKRGYVELDRDWESRLNPATVDLARFNGSTSRLSAQGIEIKTLAELQESDPHYRRKIYVLDWEASKDIPIAVQLTKPSFRQYEKNVFEDPALLPEAFFVAVDGNRYVGLTSLNLSAGGTSELKTGFTGIARAYRRRGIAMALKLRAVAYAQNHGNPVLRTWNAQNNKPMLAINARIGFVRQPGWIVYQMEIRD